MAAGWPATHHHGRLNASALEFRDEDFLESLHATLEETRLGPHFLEIELTESVLIRNAEAARSVVHAIATMGVKLAIDDFGTGYSSLSYLQRFPIHTLKIDKSFVNQMTSNADDASIVNAIISMGKSPRQRLIAEGVETPEQHASLLAQRTPILLPDSGGMVQTMELPNI
nr:EAL domain-containing protein [Rhodoferax sp.]